MRSWFPRDATWLLESLLPERDVDAVIGDLVEEYMLRSRSASPAHVSRWYWGQIARSVPALVGASIRRGAWVATVAAATGAYLVVTIVEFGINELVMSALLASTPAVRTGLSMIVGLMTTVLGGYLAARMRPGAAAVLATMVLAVVAVLMATIPDSVPLWYQIGFLILGPAAALAGGALFRRTQPPDTGLRLP